MSVVLCVPDLFSLFCLFMHFCQLLRSYGQFGLGQYNLFMIMIMFTNTFCLFLMKINEKKCITFVLRCHWSIFFCLDFILSGEIGIVKLEAEDQIADEKLLELSGVPATLCCCENIEARKYWSFCTKVKLFRKYWRSDKNIEASMEILKPSRKYWSSYRIC